MKLFFLIVLFFFTLPSSLAQQNIEKLSVKKVLTLPGETANRAAIIDSINQVKSSSTISDTELNYLDGLSSGIQSQIDGKQATISGAASTITSSDLSASKALQSDGSGKVSASSTVDSTELGYLDGVTSSIQTQFTSASSTESTNDGLSVHKAGTETITGDKLFTGQLTATSTTKGNRPCPVMTPTQRNAISSPSLGDCVINSVTNGLETFDGTIWKAAGGAGGISNWTTITSYIVGDVVIQSNKIYQANTAHTSGTFASDLANWTQIANNVTDASGVLPVDNGGTNSSTALSGSSIIVSDGTKLIQGAAGTSTTLLHGNASGAPTYAAASLTTDVSGVLPLANGGTNKNLTAVNGGVIYTDADSHEVSAVGTSSQILQSNGAAAPTWVNKSISGKAENKTAVTLEEIQFPNNQLTETASGKYLASTGNKNILDNEGFEHGTFSTSWTNSVGTFTQETSTVIDGKASAKLVLSSQTMSLTQSSTLYASAFADGVQGLVSVRIKSNVALKVCAIQAGTVSTVDCVDVASDNKWSFYKIPFILGATSNGISVASSGAVSGTVYIDDAFVGQANVTDIAPIITDWVDFPSVAAGTLITGTTTNPTYGTVVTNKAQWRRVGSDMEIRWDYRHTAAGTAGSGDYHFNLPPGYEIDTTKAKANSAIGETAGTGFDSASIGIFWGYAATQISVRGAVGVYSSTKLKTHIINGLGSLNPNAWGSASGATFNSNTSQTYGLHVTVPILGWGSNSSMYSAPCGTNCVDVFSAKVTDGVATTTVSQENSDFINGNCTNPSVGNFTCSFNSGIFIDPPNCTITEYGVNGGGTPMCKILTGSLLNTSVSIFCETSAGTDVDRSFNLLCQKQGADFTASRTIVGSFKGVVSTQGTTKPINGAAIVAAGTETTSCTVTGNCTLYRSRGNIFTSIAKTATTGTYTVTLDSSKINTSTALCTASQMHTTSSNSVCYTSTMGATFSVFCRDVTTNAIANALFNIRCDGDLP